MRFSRKHQRDKRSQGDLLEIALRAPMPGNVRRMDACPICGAKFRTIANPEKIEYLVCPNGHGGVPKK